jgi:protein SDA1
VLSLPSSRLLEILFPLLPITTSPSLRSFIKKTILTDLKTANTPSKNHKLNGVVQALLFNMVDRGMDADVVGDKGRYSLKRVMSGTGGSDMTAINRIGQEAMWAVSLIKELWRKSIWNDAKTVSIVSRATRHPNVKVQSAAIHFFLGNEDDDGLDSDDEQEDEGPNIKKLVHQRTIKKKTKADEKRFAKAKTVYNKVCCLSRPVGLA